MLIPDVGTRVVLRYRLPPGAGHLYTDVTGELLASGATLSVAGRRGEITVALSEVVAIKAIPARPVARREIRDLESAAARGWPGLQSTLIEGWLLRAGSGFTTRANCALPLAPHASLKALPAIAHWYATRNLPLQMAVIEQLLTAPPGWDKYRAASMLTAAVTSLNTADITMTLLDSPSARWLSLFRGGTAVTVEAIEVVRAVDGAATFGCYYVDGDLAAIARAAITVSDSGRKWLGLSSLEVASPYRRRGIATAMMDQLTAWGTECGATSVYLQVMQDNPHAAAMYRAIGYTEHHTYQYASPPT
ncbi:MAG: GNAT family N-acetyltransferase [Antricoccus sp.]